ncbi:aldo/keto reductase [Luteimonas sp. SJ-92]|uniref:Aldo/keto reductase n=1 Tax=Luteimonas salinisoli TaxID=2752307 RepID=A0A853JA03_9GAMM|nr:aldo/keto reductase [Luteimonas salinisoli]NZA26001.1 aldo/keto reductase [Luteimonas salinisoli]
MTSRRDFLTSTTLAATGLALAPLAACSRENPAPPAAPATSAPTPPVASAPAAEAGPLLTRAIPATGERIPAIGAGTSGSYEVPMGSGEFETLKETIRVFFEGGGSVFDTSPNYSNADEVLGALLDEGGWRERCFLATKIAEDDRAAMEAQWAETLRRLRTDRVELLQVHNLRAWEIALPYARELKEQGLTKYIGLTHYLESGHADLERIMRAERPDFIQINYSVTAPQAADSLLPAAQELGVAVLINRAFDDGKLFAQVKDKPLPAWAEGVGAASWAQLFLKFAISHPAVTAVIPATGKPDRQADNLGAGTGALLDEDQQAELIRMFA